MSKFSATNIESPSSMEDVIFLLWQLEGREHHPSCVGDERKEGGQEINFVTITWMHGVI